MDKKLILNELINHFSNGNNTKFAQMLGVSQQVVSNWKTRGVIDYELLLAKIPNLSAEWLLRGTGPMILGCTESAAPEPPAPEQKDSLLALVDKIVEYEEEKKESMATFTQELREIKHHLRTLRMEQEHRHQEDKDDTNVC